MQIWIVRRLAVSFIAWLGLSGPLSAKLLRTPFKFGLRHAASNKMIFYRLLKQRHKSKSFITQISYPLDQCESGGLGIEGFSIFMPTAMNEPIALINELLKARNQLRDGVTSRIALSSVPRVCLCVFTNIASTSARADAAVALCTSTR
jgi:hypothetical protein